MKLKKVEKHLKEQQKKQFALLKADMIIGETVEENTEKGYRIKELEGGYFLFYYDKKKDRALMLHLELEHLMDKEIFTNCLPKKWDTGKKTTKKQRKKIANRIESYGMKRFNKAIFQ